MKIRLLTAAFLLALCIPAFGFLESVFYLLEFRTDNVTNTVLISRYTNALQDAFRTRGFFLLDGFTKGPEGEDPDYMINTSLKYEGDEYAMTLVAVNITNQQDRWQDEVYTRDMTGTDGIREAARALAERSAQFRKKMRVNVYREKTDYRKIRGRTERIRFARSVDYIDIFRVVNIHAMAPYGYDFGIPIRFGLDFFDYNFIWPFGTNTTFGIGVGAKVFSYKGPEALSFLPVQVYVPLYLYPSDYPYNRADLYLHLEAGFFLLQYSYLDVNVQLMFNNLSVTLGCMYLPLWSDGTNVRAEYWTIYGGLTISFGQYGVHWR